MTFIASMISSVSPAFTVSPLRTKAGAPGSGDTVCIIEAMKVMNPIKAEKGGTIVDVLVDDAQPVEFGQVIAIIE